MLDPHRVRDSPAIGQVAVVTVTYSPGEHLHRFLRTLRHATDLPLRVILADNGSTDGAPEAAAEEPDVELLRTGGNVGYGKAANLGSPRSTLRPSGWSLPTPMCNGDREASMRCWKSRSVGLLRGRWVR